MSLETIISEICEIEVGLYLDYYNKKIKSYKEFNQELDSHRKDIIDKVYDLMEEDYTEKDIIAAIKNKEYFIKNRLNGLVKMTIVVIILRDIMKQKRIKNILLMRNVVIHYLL